MRRKMSDKEKEEFFSKMNHAYVEMRKDEVWETEEKERRLFDSVVADGLEDKDE